MFDYAIEKHEPRIYRGSEIPKDVIVCPSDEVAIQEGCYLDLEFAYQWVNWITATFKWHPYQWQKNALLKYYAWRKADGGYRTSTMSVWVPKKNGKSAMVSIILAAKMFELDRCNLYSSAVNSRQAGIIRDGVEDALRQSKEIRKLIATRKIKIYDGYNRREINNTINKCVFRSMADNIKANDGAIGAVYVADELHLMKNALYQVCDGMTDNIPDALKLIISTAGSGDTQHVSWGEYSYCKDVLSGEIIDTTLLPIIYEFADQKTRDIEKVFSMDSYMSCNPVAHEDVKIRDAQQVKMKKAKRLKQTDRWRRYNLGVWCSTDGESFIDADVWRDLEIDPIPYDVLKDCPTVIGIDIARVIDLTAVVMLHDLPDGRIYHHPICILPKELVVDASQRDDVDYSKFYDAGELRRCAGEIVSYEYVANLGIQLCKEYNIIGAGFDEHFCEYIASKMQASGIPMKRINTFSNRDTTSGANYLEQLVLDQRICHAKNSMFTWQLSCANRITTADDVYKIVKKGSNLRGKGGQGRKDAVDATIYAAMAHQHYRIEGDKIPSVVTA